MVNPRNMRVQVDRQALISAIERKQAQCRKDYERLGEKQERAIKKWQAEQVKKDRAQASSIAARANALEKMSASSIIKKMGAKNYLEVQGKTFYPPTERKGQELDGFSTILRMLRMSKKDSVSLSEQQFKAYMDGCPIQEGWR